MPSSDVEASDLTRVLSNLPVRSAVYWGAVLLSPCMELVRKECWWRLQAKRILRNSEQVIADLIAGQLDGMYGRIVEAASLTQGLNLLAGRLGQVGHALFAFFSQLDVVYDEHFSSQVRSGRIFTLISHFADVVPHVSHALSEDPQVTYDRALRVAKLLLEDVGARIENHELGPEIDRAVRDKISRLLT